MMMMMMMMMMLMMELNSSQYCLYAGTRIPLAFGVNVLAVVVRMSFTTWLFAILVSSHPLPMLCQGNRCLSSAPC